MWLHVVDPGLLSCEGSQKRRSVSPLSQGLENPRNGSPLAYLLKFQKSRWGPVFWLCSTTGGVR